MELLTFIDGECLHKPGELVMLNGIIQVPISSLQCVVTTPPKIRYKYCKETGNVEELEEEVFQHFYDVFVNMRFLNYITPYL